MFLNHRGLGWVTGLCLVGVVLLLFPDFCADCWLPGGLEESDRRFLTRALGVVAILAAGGVCYFTSRS